MHISKLSSFSFSVIRHVQLRTKEVSTIAKYEVVVLAFPQKVELVTGGVGEAVDEVQSSSEASLSNLATTLGGGWPDWKTFEVLFLSVSVFLSIACADKRHVMKEGTWVFGTYVVDAGIKIAVVMVLLHPDVSWCKLRLSNWLKSFGTEATHVVAVSVTTAAQS